MTGSVATLAVLSFAMLIVSLDQYIVVVALPDIGLLFGGRAHEVDHELVRRARTDECEGGGCEPGDLTKRMSPPWQSDLYQCSIEWINFDDPTANYTNPSNTSGEHRLCSPLFFSSIAYRPQLSRPWKPIE